MSFRTIKQIFIIPYLLQVLITQPALASPDVGAIEDAVVVVAAKDKDTDADVMAATMHKVTFAHAVLRALPDALATRSLATQFERAQKQWLLGSLADARASFESIANRALETSWQMSQIKVIQYSMLRLAQSANNDSDRQSWLRKAALLSPDTEPDREIFPPPLVKESMKIRAQVLAESTSITLSEASIGFTHVLIDGRQFAIKTETAIKLTKGLHHFTFVSSRFAPDTEVMSASAVREFQPSQRALVLGTCHEPSLELNKSDRKLIGEHRELTAIFDDDCSRDFANEAWVNNELSMNLVPKLALSIDSKSAIHDSSSIDLVAHKGLQDPFNEPAHQIEKPSYGWVWLLVAGAVAVYAIQQRNSQPSDPGTTTVAVHHE